MLEQDLVETYVDLFIEGSVSLLDLDWTASSHQDQSHREAARKAIITINFILHRVGLV